jgi:hypothetical protein
MYRISHNHGERQQWAVLRLWTKRRRRRVARVKHDLHAREDRTVREYTPARVHLSLAISESTGVLRAGHCAGGLIIS